MAQINIRIDDELKNRAENIFEELGLNMTTAFTMFIRQTIRQGGIPFDITTRTDPFYNTENIKVLHQSIKEAEEGKLTAHELIEEQAMEKLWTDKAWDDYVYWQSQNKKMLMRINQLLKDIERNCYDGIGKPESLRGDLSGWWCTAHVELAVLKVCL